MTSRAGLLSHRLHSQIAMHQAYGGVVPELASRDHVRRLLPLVRGGARRCRLRTGFDRRGGLHGGARSHRRVVGRRGVCAKPGLRLGQTGHRGASSRGAPVWRRCSRPMPPAFPVSWPCWSPGDIPSWSTWRVSAATEFWVRRWTMRREKPSTRRRRCWVCRIPGVRRLRGLARAGRGGRFDFPRPMLDRPGLEFSFSGLKTAALVALRGRELDDEMRADVARGFQEAVVETLAEKSRRALAGDRPPAIGRGRRRRRQPEPARAAEARSAQRAARNCIFRGRSFARTTAR